MGRTCLGRSGRAGAENVVSVVGGKLTTYRQMAGVTTDFVCEGFEAACETDRQRLLDDDDPARLDELVSS